MGVQESLETGLLTAFRDWCQSYWDWLTTFFKLKKKAADKVSERLSPDSSVLEVPVKASLMSRGAKAGSL